MLYHIPLQIISDLIRIPGGTRHQALHPVGRLFSRGFRQMPAIPPLCTPEQPFQVGAHPSARLRTAKVGSQPRVQPLYRLCPPGALLYLDHDPPPHSDPVQRTASNVQL